MIYGSPVLRKVAKDIDKDYEGLDEFIENMFSTMYSSDGIGLAAPQIGKSIRLFVMDASPFEEDYPELKDFKKVFINAQITERSGEPYLFNEGCLSIPNLREDVERPEKIKIEYYNVNWEFCVEEYEGIVARIIQHEYDHLDGKMFTDRLSSLKKKMITGKLRNISKGKFNIDYKYRLPKI